MFRVVRFSQLVKQPLCSLPRTYAVAVWHGDPETNVSSLRKAELPVITEQLQREINALAARVGQTFTNKSLLIEAVTDVTTDPAYNNKRLSVLGESVANQAVLEHFLTRYPNLPMYSLRSLRNHVLSLKTLAKVARRIGLQNALNITLPAQPSKKQTQQSMDKPVTDAFNALIGAIHLDQGSAQSHKFARDLLLTEVADVDIAEFVRLATPVTLLTQLLVANNQPAPTDKLIKESGRLTHLPTFVVEVYSGSKPLAQGASYSLKTAKLEAYRAALREHFAETYKNAPLPSDADMHNSV
jgi:large subunit ribosomal protein L44